MLRNLRQVVAVVLAGILVLVCVGRAGAEDNTLFPLPWKAYGSDGNLRQQAILNSVSNQKISAYPGETVYVTTFFSVYNMANPLERQQLFLIDSWTPQWPPPADYYYVIYDGVPGLAPGTSQALEVPIKAPVIPGTYYLWFCSTTGFNAQTAINSFSNILPPIAHMMITVTPRDSVAFLVSDSPGGKSTYGWVAGQSIKEGMVPIGTVYYTPGVQYFAASVESMTAIKSRIIWVICADEERPSIEKEFRKSGFVGEIRYTEGKYISFTVSDNISELSAPFAKGDIVRYRLFVSNTGWLPLDVVTTDFSVSRPGLAPLWTDTKSLTALPVGATATTEMNWPVPQSTDGSEYLIKSITSGFEGPGKSGISYHAEKMTTIVTAPKFPNSLIIPIVLGIVALGLIGAIVVSSRRKSAGKVRRGNPNHPAGRR